MCNGTFTLEFIINVIHCAIKTIPTEIIKSLLWIFTNKAPSKAKHTPESPTVGIA